MHPVTIVSDRYNGTYSKAKWLAFNMYEHLIPIEISSGDPECSNFWWDLDRTMLIGKGNTPTEAYENLILITQAANAPH